MGVRLLGSWVGHDPPQLIQAKALAGSLVAAASAAAAAVAEEALAVQRLPPAPYGDSQDDGNGRHVHADGGSRVQRRHELQKGMSWRHPLRGWSRADRSIQHQRLWQEAREATVLAVDGPGAKPLVQTKR